MIGARVLAVLALSLTATLFAVCGDDGSKSAVVPPAAQRLLDAFVEHRVGREGYEIYVRDYPGEEPAFVLMHGFPDSLRLYDRLIPALGTEARVVVFDFLGWGLSDKRDDLAYSYDALTADLGAVVDALGLDAVIPVVHDASGPPGIDWALDNPERTRALVVLNSFYAPAPRIQAPEAIWLFATPEVRDIANLVSADLELSRQLYFWQVGRFFRDADIRAEFLPLFWELFVPAFPAFLALNDQLFAEVVGNLDHLPRMAAFERPVRVIFGAADPYLNVDVAADFAARFPSSELLLIEGARHYVQMDEPVVVAERMRELWFEVR